MLMDPDAAFIGVVLRSDERHSVGHLHLHGPEQSGSDDKEWELCPQLVRQQLWKRYQCNLCGCRCDTDVDRKLQRSE